MKKTAGLCHDIATANGFDPCTWDNLPIKAMLVITELHEAMDAADGVGDPLSEELADIAIRLLGMLHGIWGDDWHVRPLVTPVGNNLERIEVIMRPTGRAVSRAVEAWRCNNQVDARGWLEVALRNTRHVAIRVGVNLGDAIYLKCVKNRGRGKLHGKARAEG